jgi:RNA-directed DNA polymerase
MDISKTTILDIAKYACISPENLLGLADKAPYLYYERKKTKKGGGFRIIAAPHDNLKKIQTALLEKFLSKLPLDPTLFGHKGTSAKKAVLCHTRKPLVITLDIKNFFPSIKACTVRKMLLSRGASNEVAKLLTKLSTHKNQLPQGAPTSSYIASLVLHPIVAHVKKALASTGTSTSLSIWVDNITISGPSGLVRIQKTISGIFKRHGLIIPPHKIKPMPHSQEQESLNIRLNDGTAPTSSYLAKYQEASRQLGSSHRKCRGMKAYITGLQK